MKPSKTEVFTRLTWIDIQAWAGSTIVTRGQSYQRNHRVKELARTPSGGVVAWVRGTQRYATLIDIEGEELTSACTCAYWDTCKHAVAVVLEYLDHLRRNIEVPTVTERDQRLALLRKSAEEDVWNQGDDADEEEDADRGASRRLGKTTRNALKSYLEQQTRAQLIALLEELAERYPVVHEALQDRRDLSLGMVAQLVNSVREEIDTLSVKPGWSNAWNDEGYVPDYSRVRDHLEVLLTRGYADEVITLGGRLLEAGTRQVEMSHDEGETAGEISSCLDVVFRALARSSLSPAEQMLWAVEAELNDEYDLCEGAEVFWQQEHTVADWNTLAEKLMRHLGQHKPTKDDDGFSREYRRDRLTNWLIMALAKAGRQEEIIPLCEREAVETGSYVRLVNYLVEADHREEAEHWVHRGIKATQKQWPGIASELRTILRETRETENDWLTVAAFRGEDFLAQPSLQTFQELQKAAERAEVWPAVRVAIMHYLETGDLPETGERAAKDRAIPPWPLPKTGVMETTKGWQMHFPMTRTLIDIAIAEGQPDEVIRWYDQRRQESAVHEWTWFQENRIAEAVADTHPERAVAIWKKTAEGHIARTQPKAYEVAASCLRSIRHVLRKLGRENEWENYIAELRQTNRRKRRLLQILDGLTGRPIIEGS